MKKIIFLIVLITFTSQLFAQLTMTKVWERSDSLYSVTKAAENQKPAYFDNMNTRGIAFGTINSSTGAVERVFLPSRHETGNVVRVLNAETGADVKSLDMTDVTGGGFIISDAAVTEDGVLLVSNCTHSSSGPLKIYKWTNEDEKSTLEISYPTGTARFGDKITVTGKYNDGTARIYVIAGAALTNHKVKYFAMEKVDNVWKFKQTPDELNTSITAASSNFHQFNPGPNGGFYFRSVGLNNFQQIKPDLTANIGNSHPATIAQGSTVPVFIKTVGDYDYACYLRYGSSTFAAPANNKIEVVKIERALGITSAKVMVSSPSFGNLNPGNGAGHVVLKHLPNGDVDIFVLSTQNGVARYRLSGLSTGLNNNYGNNLQLHRSGNKLIVDADDIKSIEIYNLAGQQLLQSKHNNFIGVDGLSGLHIIKVKRISGEQNTVKFVF